MRHVWTARPVVGRMRRQLRKGDENPALADLNTHDSTCEETKGQFTARWAARLRWRLFQACEGKRDLRHGPVCFGQYLDDLLVVANVVPRQGAAAPVLQPFLGGLITADEETPGQFGHGVEILVRVDVDRNPPVGAALFR